MHPRLFIILSCYKLIQWWIQGRGPGGLPPLMLGPNCGPKGRKNFAGRRPPPHLSKDLDNRAPLPYLKVWFQHYKCYYFLCLGLRLTCKKLKNNCISLNLFHFNAAQIHCSVFGVRCDINAKKEWAVRFVKRFFHRYLRLLLCQGFFKL